MSSTRKPVAGTALNLRYMLEGTPVRMRYTYRWATSRVVNRENVAEHSWFVAFYALCVTHWLWENHRIAGMDLVKFKSNVLTCSVLHDIEECRTGDIHRPFKHSTQQIREAMESAGVEAARQVFGGLFGGNEKLPEEMLHDWNVSKCSSPEGRVVAFADILAVIAFCLQEGPDVVKALCLETLPNHFKKFQSSEYDFIRPLVNDAAILLGEIIRE